MPNRSACSRALLAALALGTALPVVSAPRPAHAQAAVVCVNCSDQITQLLQYAKEAETYLTEAQTQFNTATMLANQIQNMTHLPGQVVASITGDISQVQNLLQRGTQLSINAGFVSSQLSNFSSYLNTPINFYQKYTGWSQQANDAAAATLSGLGLQQNQMASDQAVLAAIQARSATSGGTVQAIQALTEMTGQLVTEMEKLRQLIMADAQQNANGLRIATDRQATGDANLTTFMSTPAPVASGNPRY